MRKSPGRRKRIYPSLMGKGQDGASAPIHPLHRSRPYVWYITYSSWWNVALNIVLLKKLNPIAFLFRLIRLCPILTLRASGWPVTLFTVCLLYKGNVIGCGRVIGDGGLYFHLQDVIVLPVFQGKGLGKRLMKAIMAYLEEHALPGAFVGLMAAKGVNNFYMQFGFAVRPPERPGMFRL